MRCVILQPSYIPWRGYFDLIHRADVFVFYDDVQYDKHGWRNRNRIKTERGPQWLTIPARSRGATEGLAIRDVQTNQAVDWPRKHLAALRQNYASAPHFHDFLPWLERVYSAPPPLLADFTIATTIDLAAMLGITSTTFLRSSALGIGGGKTDRLVNIVRHVGATEYLSGPSARDYIEPEKFAEAGIALEYAAYDYPEYPQLHPPYDPHVSILDLLFMTGDDAPTYIWGANR
jgi:hypothetical protein